MATYQTDYSTEYMPIGIQGQIANEEKHNQISRTVETADGIPYGAPCQRGAEDHGADLYTTGDFLGLAVLTAAVPPAASGANPDSFPLDFTLPIMTQGTMYVEVGGAVNAGDAVFYDAANNRFNAAAVGAETALPSCVFDTSAAAAGDIAEISIKHRSF